RCSWRCQADSYPPRCEALRPSALGKRTVHLSFRPVHRWRQPTWSVSNCLASVCSSRPSMADALFIGLKQSHSSARKVEKRSPNTGRVVWKRPEKGGGGRGGEILRRGNEGQSFGFYPTVGGRRFTVLRGFLGPPYFSLLRALDRNGSPTPRAYREHAPG